MEHLISLAEPPPHCIVDLAARLAALPGAAPIKKRLEQDINALLERTLQDSKRVWKLRPQVRNMRPL